VGKDGRGLTFANWDDASDQPSMFGDVDGLTVPDPR
jgi:hypothetical protein